MDNFLFDWIPNTTILLRRFIQECLPQQNRLKNYGLATLQQLIYNPWFANTCCQLLLETDIGASLDQTLAPTPEKRKDLDPAKGGTNSFFLDRLEFVLYRVVLPMANQQTLQQIHKHSHKMAKTSSSLIQHTQTHESVNYESSNASLEKISETQAPVVGGVCRCLSWWFR